MREKLETLPLTQLKEFAKSQGLKITGLRKAQIIDLLCEAAEKKPENKPQEIHSLAAQPLKPKEPEAAPAEPENAERAAKPEETSEKKAPEADAPQEEQNLLPSALSLPHCVHIILSSPVNYLTAKNAQLFCMAVT